MGLILVLESLGGVKARRENRDVIQTKTVERTVKSRLIFIFRDKGGNAGCPPDVVWVEKVEWTFFLGDCIIEGLSISYLCSDWAKVSFYALLPKQAVGGCR